MVSTAANLFALAAVGSTPMADGGTALAVYDPRSFSELQTLAFSCHKSGLFGVSSPEAALAIMMTGVSLGLHPIAALRGINNIKGKTTLSADLMAAVIQRADQCEYWQVIECDDDHCTIETKRRSHKTPTTRTWTLANARRAKLTHDRDTDSNWAKYPSAMLRARCTSELGRMVYPDLLFGVYVEGELDDPQSARAPAPRRVEVHTAQVSVESKPVEPTDTTCEPAPEEQPAPELAAPIAAEPDELIVRIQATKTKAELLAVGKEIGQLPKDSGRRPRLAAAYKDQQAKLVAEKAAPATDAPAVPSEVAQ